MAARWDARGRRARVPRGVRRSAQRLGRRRSQRIATAKTASAASGKRHAPQPDAPGRVPATRSGARTNWFQNHLRQHAPGFPERVAPRAPLREISAI